MPHRSEQPTLFELTACGEPLRRVFLSEGSPLATRHSPLFLLSRHWLLASRQCSWETNEIEPAALRPVCSSLRPIFSLRHRQVASLPYPKPMSFNQQQLAPIVLLVG